MTTKQKKGCTLRNLPKGKSDTFAGSKLCSKPAKQIKLTEGAKIQFELSNKDYYYCPLHGKCPAVEGTWNHGAFFCKKCGMIKTLDVYGNCHGLADAEVIL